MKKKHSHKQIRRPDGTFAPNTKKNEANKLNTVEQVPNAGYGTTGKRRK